MSGAWWRSGPRPWPLSPGARLPLGETVALRIGVPFRRSSLEWLCLLGETTGATREELRAHWLQGEERRRGKACRAAVPASGAGARGAWSSCRRRRKRAHPRPVPETGSLLPQPQVPARRPRGSSQCRCRACRAGARVRPSASSAHGAEPPRPWRPQPPSRPRPPEQHPHACRRGPVSSPPSARPDITPRHPARAGPGRRRRAGSAVAQVAAAPRRARARRRPRGGAAAGCLFWVRPAPPSSSRQWEACARLRASRVRARVCASPRGPRAALGGAPAPGSARKPCERAAGAPAGTPGAAGARGLPKPHLVCGCSAPPRRPPSSRPRGEQRSTRRTHCGDLPAGPRGVSFSGPRFENRLSLPSLMNKSLDSRLATPEMTLTRSHTGPTFFVFRGLFPHLGGGSREERRGPCRLCAAPAPGRPAALLLWDVRCGFRGTGGVRRLGKPALSPRRDARRRGWSPRAHF